MTFFRPYLGHPFFPIWGAILAQHTPNMAPSWGQDGPTWGQLGAKLAPSWCQVGFFVRQVASYMQFGQHSKNLKQTIVFFMILLISSPQMEAMLGQIGVMLGYVGHLGAFFFHLKLHVG